MEAPGDGLLTVKPTRVYYLQARAVFIYLLSFLMGFFPEPSFLLTFISLLLFHL